MKSLEERLRDAYRSAADTVRPDAIRALPEPELRSRRRTISAEPRHGRMFAPLAAAAATATVAIAASVVVPHLTADNAQSAGHHGRHHPASSSAAQSSSVASAAGLPEYVLENNGATLQVVATATWQTVGQITAPAGQTLEAAAGAADDRTFVVAADLNMQTTCSTWLYELQLNSQGQPGTLMQLGPKTAGLPTSIAISADGRTVGYSIVHCAGGAARQISLSQAIGKIGVLNVASGQSKEWSFSLAEDYTRDLSLSGDGSRIGFSSYLDGVPAGSNTTPVGRVISADAPTGTVLQRAQILIRPTQSPYSGVDSVALSPDGGTLYACTHSGSSATDETQSVRAYDTATGQQTRVLRTWHKQDLTCALTADPAGGHLLLSTNLMTSAPGGPPPLTLTWIDLSTNGSKTLPLSMPSGATLSL